MAIVRLEFDLDSDIYPELHAALLSLRGTRARAERIRQLASAGLVWENVRIYGAGAIGQTPADVKTAPPRAEPPARSARPPAAERGRRRAAAEPVADPRGDDFIDLAIDAMPEPAPEPESTPSPSEQRRARAAQRDATRAPRNLPVLMDVVTDSDVGGPPPELRPAAPPTIAPAAVVTPPVLRAAAEPLPSAMATGERDDASAQAEAGAVPEDAIHLTSLAQKPATRSRLMRMKDKGLFKNG